jgi:hypothetical protein
MRIYAEQLGSHLERRGLPVQRIRVSYRSRERPCEPGVRGSADGTLNMVVLARRAESPLSAHP